MMKKVPVVAVVLSSLFPFKVIGSDQPKPKCATCGMEIEKQDNIYFKAVMQDGSLRYLASVSCLAAFRNANQDKIKEVFGVDYKSGSLVKPEGKFVLWNSKVKLSRPSCDGAPALLFEKRQDAEAAAKKSGGEVMSFEDALRKIAAKTGGEMKHGASAGKPDEAMGGTCGGGGEECPEGRKSKAHEGHESHEGHQGHEDMNHSHMEHK